MAIALSSKQAFEELERLDKLGKKPPFQFPAFLIETDYTDAFAYIIECVPWVNNIVPFMDRLIDQALEQSIHEMCSLLDRYKADGTQIFELMSDKQFILMGHRKAYNKMIPGRTPKGILPDLWKAYNNWLLAEIFWKAYIQSHNPSLKIQIKEHEFSKGALASMYNPDFRPLWAMKQAYAQYGAPAQGYAKDDIFVRPIAEWHIFIKKNGEVSPDLHPKKGSMAK